MAQAKFILSLMQPLAVIPRHQNDNQNAHSAGSCIPQDVVISYWYLYDRLRAAGVQRAVVLTRTHFNLIIATPYSSCGGWQSRRRSNGGLPTCIQPQQDCHVAALLAMTAGQLGLTKWVRVRPSAVSTPPPPAAPQTVARCRGRPEPVRLKPARGGTARPRRCPGFLPLFRRRSSRC